MIVHGNRAIRRAYKKGCRQLYRTRRSYRLAMFRLFCIYLTIKNEVFKKKYVQWSFFLSFFITVVHASCFCLPIVNTFFANFFSRNFSCFLRETVWRNLFSVHKLWISTKKWPERKTPFSSSVRKGVFLGAIQVQALCVLQADEHAIRGGNILSAMPQSHYPFFNTCQ